MEQFIPYLIIAGAVGAVVYFVRKKKNKTVVRKGYAGHVDKTRNMGKNGLK